MGECWRCKQKAEYQQAKLTEARLEAKRQAIQLGVTMAIIKHAGGYYLAEKRFLTGQDVVEYISDNQHNMG